MREQQLQTRGWRPALRRGFVTVAAARPLLGIPFHSTPMYFADGSPQVRVIEPIGATARYYKRGRSISSTRCALDIRIVGATQNRPRCGETDGLTDKRQNFPARSNYSCQSGFKAIIESCGLLAPDLR